MAKMLDMPPGTVKGLLKGLRYISQVFDAEKEQEMIIGVPTDVKHVAHIGWDGPAAAVNNNPSWMNDLQSAPSSTTSGPDAKEVGSKESATRDISVGRHKSPSPAGDEEVGSNKPRRARRQTSSKVPGSEAPARESRGGSRHSRKPLTTGSVPVPVPVPVPGSELPAREGESSRRGRRHHKSDTASGSEAVTRYLPTMPKTKKKERRIKVSDGGSTGSRSKNPSSCPDAGAEERAARPVEEAVI